MELHAHRQSVCIVVPVFNEEEVLPQFFSRIREVVTRCEAKVSVLYIDDGSRDHTFELLQKESQNHPWMSVIQLSRNFGQQSALRAGLDEAQSDAVIFIDADLQDPPELIHEMVTLWKKGAEVVVAQRRSRAERGLRGLCFSLFHKFYSKLSHDLIPPNSGIYGLIHQNVVEALRSCPETNLYLQGLRGWVGFRQEVVLYDRPERAAGEPKQSFLRLVQYAWNAIASFSVLPLRAILVIGTCISGASFLYGLCLLLIRFLQFFGLFHSLETPGFTTLAVAIFFLGGIQLIGIGLVGEYLARVYDECKRRPLYLVKRKLP